MLFRSFLSSLLISIATWGGFVGRPVDARARVVATEVANSGGDSSVITAGTPRQKTWLQASPDQRVKHAEQLGDEGARRFASSRKWTPVYDGTVRAVVQGPDQVYRELDDIIHVVEAKGGGSPLGRGYGYVQGTPEWAVESAKRVLSHPHATAAERNGAKAVLEAATTGKLRVHVVRTAHVLGEPTVAVLEQTLHCSNAATQLARAAGDDAVKAAAQVADNLAKQTGGAMRTGLKTAAKAVVPAAVIVDVGVRVHDAVETERQFAAGEITVQQREVDQAKNAAGMAGGWTGAAGGVWVAGEVAAPVAALTGPAAPYVEGVAVVAGAVAGYYFGEEGARQAAEWTVRQIHETGTTVSDTAGAAWCWTSDACSSGWRTVFGK